MLLLFDVGVQQSQNGQDLYKYLPRPCQGISYYEVKDFIRGLPFEYRKRFIVRVWTPNTNPSDDDTVRVVEVFNASEFDKQFRRWGYNRARMIIESRHDIKYDGGWDEL